MLRNSIILIIVTISILIWQNFTFDKYISISLLQVGWILICYSIVRFQLGMNLYLFISILYGLNMMIFLSNKLAIFH